MMAAFFASSLGGDVEKIGDFQERKIRSHGSIFWHHLLGAMLKHKLFSTTWGDVTQNDDVQSKKTALRGCKRFSLRALGGDVKIF